jgi:hypothetical protein
MRTANSLHLQSTENAVLVDIPQLHNKRSYRNTYLLQHFGQIATSTRSFKSGLDSIERNIIMYDRLRPGSRGRERSILLKDKCFSDDFHDPLEPWRLPREFARVISRSLVPIFILHPHVFRHLRFGRCDPLYITSVRSNTSVEIWSIRFPGKSSQNMLMSAE